MAQMTNQDVLASFRRQSISARSKSRFRGVKRDDVTGKWLARKAGTSKDCLLGKYETEEEAAIAFDIECIKQNGYLAITNYDLRCYDVDKIIKAQKLFIKQQEALLELQATKGFLMKPQPPEKPKASHLNVVPKSLETEDQRNQFRVWALERARKELNAKASSSSSFKHGAFSPFCSYYETKQYKDEQRNSMLGLGHGSSGAIEYYSRHGHGQSSYGTEEIVPRRLLGPYQVSLATEELLRAQGLGFEHSASSGFKPYNSSSSSNGN